MSSSLDLPRTGKSIPIALALRACVRAKLRARDVSAVAGGGLVEKGGASVPPAVRALGSRVGPASGWPLAGWPGWLGWPGWPGWLACARDVSAVAGGGLVQKPGRPAAIRALGSRVGPAPCWPCWAAWPGLVRPRET